MEYIISQLNHISKQAEARIYNSAGADNYDSILDDISSSAATLARQLQELHDLQQGRLKQIQSVLDQMK